MWEDRGAPVDRASHSVLWSPRSPDTTRSYFTTVPEAKAGKNRLHIDLRPKDQAAEVARLEALGARRVDVGQGADVTWVVLAGPDGNEFCVLRALRPEEEAAAGSPS
ncbi:MAG: VOC family protein [Streptosporangiaceae bacterium]